MLKSYKDLLVWQKSILLVEEIYKLTKVFPKEEMYGMTAQMRRAAVSIPSNISEGSKRKDLPEYLYFLRTADGSAAELETQLIIAKKLYGNCDFEASMNLLLEVQNILNVMIAKLSDKLNDRA